MRDNEWFKIQANRVWKANIDDTAMNDDCAIRIIKQIYSDALADAKAAVIAVLNANGSPSVGVAIIKAIEGVK